MSTNGPAGTELSARMGFAFSPRGLRAASVGVAGDTALLESWQLGAGEVVQRQIAGFAVDRATSLLPLDDGSLVLWQQCGSQRHEITMYPATAEGVPGTDGHKLGSLTALGGYLLPGPVGWSAPGLAVTVDDADRSTIWRLGDAPPGIERIVRLPGLLSGGAWIDEAGRALAINQTPRGGRQHGIVVDLSDGSWRRTWFMSEASTDQILLCSPATRLLVVSSNASGEPRLGWGVLGQRTVHFPEVLHRRGYPRHPLAVDDRGERVLVHERAGAVSRLFVYTPANDSLTPLDTPRGIVSSPACWAGDVVRVPFSQPAHPRTLATLRFDDRSAAKPAWSLHQATTSSCASADAELVELDGAAGPIEAIVYGGTGWRYRERLVVALHGGPLSAWGFEFDPLFHSLASAGMTVLAPNCRGSTGYGEEHLRSALGKWGGPDLDDVRHLCARLERDRRRSGLPAPIVLGVSYGAYLALLAACADPDSWSGCVALAPLLSPAALNVDAADAVRDRIGELGGLDENQQQGDVLSLCASLRAPLLLVHGRRDEHIPVRQSRILHRRLLDLGRHAGTDLDYVELDTNHAGVVADWPSELLRRIERFCLTRTATTGGMRQEAPVATHVGRG